MAEKVERFAYMYANLSNLERFAYTEPILERFANIELNFEIFRNKYFYQPKDLIFYLSKTKTDNQVQSSAKAWKSKEKKLKIGTHFWGS